jgi:hypothetical protein
MTPLKTYHLYSRFKRTCQSPAEYASPIERPLKSPSILPLLGLVCVLIVTVLVIPFLLGYFRG